MGQMGEAAGKEKICDVYFLVKGLGRHGIAQLVYQREVRNAVVLPNVLYVWVYQFCVDHAGLIYRQHLFGL